MWLIYKHFSEIVWQMYSFLKTINGKTHHFFPRCKDFLSENKKLNRWKKSVVAKKNQTNPHTHTLHICSLICFAWVVQFCAAHQICPCYIHFDFFSCFVHTHIHMLIRIKRKYTNGNGVLKKSTRNTSFLRHNLQYFLSLSSFLFCFVLFCKFQWRLVNFSRQLSCVAIVGSGFFTLTWWSWRVSKREKSAYIRIQCGGKPFVVRFKAVCYVDPFIEAMNLIACCFDFDAAREKLGRKMRTNYETPNVCTHAK